MLHFPLTMQRILAHPKYTTNIFHLFVPSNRVLSLSFLSVGAFLWGEGREGECVAQARRAFTTILTVFQNSAAGVILTFLSGASLSPFVCHVLLLNRCQICTFFILKSPNLLYYSIVRGDPTQIIELIYIYIYIYFFRSNIFFLDLILFEKSFQAHFLFAALALICFS